MRNKNNIEVAFSLSNSKPCTTFGTVVLNHIKNPFDPLASKETKTDIHGQALSTYLPAFNLGVEYLVKVNNNVLPIDYDYESYIVKQNDIITFTPVTSGGGGGGAKDVVRLVALVALTVAAPYMGGFLATGVWATSSTLLAAVYTAGVVMAGSLLINALLPPVQSNAFNSTSAETTSSTYSWTGVETNRNINTVIPVLYGTHALGGTVINNRFYYDESDDWLAIQLALCHGEIEEVSEDNIYINDNTYSSFINIDTDESATDVVDIYYEQRSGTFDQSIMTGFDDSIYNNLAVSRKLTYNEPYIFQSTSTNIDFFRVHFEFPNGLYSMNKSTGEKYTAQVQVELEYREVGSSTWLPLNVSSINYVKEYELQYTSGIYFSRTNNTIWSTSNSPQFIYNNKGENVYAYPTGKSRIVQDGNTVSNIITFRNDISTAYKLFYEPCDALGNTLTLPSSQYEFKATRLTEPPYDSQGAAYEDDPYNQNICHIRFLEEVETTDLNYGGIALLGVNIKATDQLSNSRPNFKVIATRKELNLPEVGYKQSTNPAWACFDILTNTHYGMGLNTSKINITEFERWAEFCDNGTPTYFNVSSSELSGNNLVKPTGLIIPIEELPNGEFLEFSKVNTNLSSLSVMSSDGISLSINNVTGITAFIAQGETLYFYLRFDRPLLEGSSFQYNIYCESVEELTIPKLKFNGVFDTTGDIWSNLQEVAKVGRGQIILQGSSYSVIFDEPKAVSGLYNASNSNNVEVSYIGRTDVATEIELQYTDKNINYEMNVISVQDADAMNSGIRSNKTSVQLKGITSEEEALVMGRYLLASSKYLRRKISFDADIESITQTVGDVIAVQTDVTQYGKGGLIKSVMGVYVTLEESVTLIKGTEYTLKIKNHLTDEIKDYYFIAGDSNYTDLLNFDHFPYTPVGAFKFDDFYLLVDFESSSLLETSMLVVPAGYAINQNDRYSFGVKGSDSILCTIIDISRNGDLTRKISALEYNESILDFDYDNDVLQRIEPTVRPKNAISNIDISDRLVKLSTNETVAMLSISWDSKVSSSYNIYLLENGFKNYLASNIKGTRYEYPAVDLLPEKEYIYYIEDATDVGITAFTEYSITSFSAPPEDIDSFTISVVNDTLRIDISYPDKPLDFKYYNLYNDDIAIKFASDTYLLEPTENTLIFEYSLAAIDMIDKTSNIVTSQFTATAPIINGVSSKVESNLLRVDVDASKGTFSIDYYEVTILGTTYKSKDASYLLNLTDLGSHTITVKAYDILGNMSNIFTGTLLDIEAPLIDNVDVYFENNYTIINTTSTKGTYDLSDYYVTYDGISYTFKDNIVKLPTTEGITKSVEVYATDIYNNESNTYSLPSIPIDIPNVNSLQFRLDGDLYKVTINSTKGSFPIDYYEVKFSSISFNTKELIFDLPISWVGTQSVSIKAYDTIGNESLLYTQNTSNVVSPTITNVSNTIEKEYVKLSISSTQGTLPIAYYEVINNGITYKVTDASYSVLADWVGSKTFTITAFDTVGNPSASYITSVNLTVPNVTGLLAVIDDKDILLSWNTPNTGLNIDYYEISYDTNIIRSKSSTYRIPVTWSGSKSFTVKTVTTLGQYSSGVSAELAITLPTISTLQTEVIDNNVLFKWQGTAGSLPIDTFMLYKGTDVNNLVSIGEKKGTFTTVFENEAGTYTYWLSAIDSAGNEGTKYQVSTRVSEPPDYVLNVLWESDFSGTKSNAKTTVDNSLLLPINTSETIQEHFTSNSWTTPQQQISAGYPRWVEPFELTGYYEETFDYGVLLASSLITMTLGYDVLQGIPNLNTTLSISSDGITYTDYTNQLQVYGTGFRYVKVRVTVSGTNSALLLNQLDIKLDSKIKNDSGSGYANSSDTTGTLVNFNKTFVDITSINVTPNSTSPIIAIYDFLDVPNPTSFKVLLYDTDGNRLSGNFSWSARGY